MSAPDDVSQEMNGEWDRLMELQRKQAVVGKLHNLQQVKRNKKQFSDAVSSRMFWIGIVVGIVAYYAKNIYMSVQYHPKLKEWWKRSSEDMSRYATPGEEVHRLPNGELSNTALEIPSISSTQSKLAVTLYQICTTCDYPTVASLMNLLLIWANLTQKGALFMKACINYFEVMNSDTRQIRADDGSIQRPGYLNFLHYHGAVKDYMQATVKPMDLIFNTNLRPTDPTVANYRKEWIKQSWNASRKNGNIWFHMFPHNKMNEAGDELFTCKLFQNIAKFESGSLETPHLKFEELVDGGLVRIAKSSLDQTQTAVQLIDELFGTTTGSTGPDCTATAIDGALNGALGMGMVAPGLMGMGIHGALIGLLSVAGAAIGGITGYEASKESCCSKTNPDGENCVGSDGLLANIIPPK